MDTTRNCNHGQCGFSLSDTIASVFLLVVGFGGTCAVLFGTVSGAFGA